MKEIQLPETPISSRKDEILSAVVTLQNAVVYRDSGAQNIVGILRNNIPSQNLSILNMNRWTAVKNILAMVERGDPIRYLVVRQFDSFLRGYEEFQDSHEKVASELIRLKSQSPGMMLTFEGENPCLDQIEHGYNIRSFLGSFNSVASIE